MSQVGSELRGEKRRASELQAKAILNATRLRILRLCNDRQWTNAALADRLNLDPSTVLHHIRILVAADLLVPGNPRQSASGAFEKPYRSTGLSWRLLLDEMAETGAGEEPAQLTAFREEFAEAGYDAAVEMVRFQLHFDEGELKSFLADLHALVEQHVQSEPGRAVTERSGYGFFVAAHKMRDAD